MTIDELKAKLCKDIVLGAFERDGRKFIVTSFTYPVGDSVNLYLVGDGDEMRVSDLGTTSYTLRVSGIDLDTEPRQEFLRSVCVLNDVQMDEQFAFSKRIGESTVNADVLAFCESITRISTLQYEQRPRHYSGLAREVGSLLRFSLPENVLTEHWHDPAIDPDAAYPVDYHLNSIGKPRNIFAVASRLRAEQAVGTVNFFHANQRFDETMAVVAPDLGLPRRVVKRLEMVSRVTFWTSASERAVIKFAMDR